MSPLAKRGRSGFKVCPYCGAAFWPNKKWPGNFKVQVFCSKKCDTARKRYTPEQIAAAFWQRVSKTKSCWFYNGARNVDGYGVVSANARIKSAHRTAWELANGTIPKGMCVLHRCDVRNCVNPAHLFLGTHQENMADAKRKGRMPLGEQCNAKLTAQKVREIRALKGRMFQKDIAKKYGINLTYVSQIWCRRTWKHVE